MNLAELLQYALTDSHSGLKPSRVGPLRSTVKRYASCLGVTPEECPADLYYLPRETRDAILEAGVPRDLTPNTLRNLKGTVTWLMTMVSSMAIFSPMSDYTVGPHAAGSGGMARECDDQVKRLMRSMDSAIVSDRSGKNHLPLLATWKPTFGGVKVVPASRVAG